MYSIAEEDSFLPAIISSNPTKQLAQIRGYYEQQKLRQIYLARDMEEIRLAYAMRICEERDRVRKSLWELDNRKRRLMLQVTNNKLSSYGTTRNKGNRSKDSSRHRRGHDKRKELKETRQTNVELKKEKTLNREQSRLATGLERQTSRLPTSTTENNGKRKLSKQIKPEIPRYLLC